MAILVDESTRVVVQGITGRQGSFHTKLMLDYGTKIVAGVTPGKGGQHVHGIPVYDTMAGALGEHEANASVLFVPARSVLQACMEAMDNGLSLLVIITEMTPLHDAFKIMSRASKEGVRVVGPNTPGVITPGRSKVGIMPGHVFKAGDIGVVSRSGTLMYEVTNILSAAGIGQSTCIGVGGDRIVGLKMVDVLSMFNEDEQTRAVAIIGEIGGRMEEEAAEYVGSLRFEKPTTAFIAGRSAPPEKRMGHAGAIIRGDLGTYSSKEEALRQAGVEIAEKPSDMIKLLCKNI